MRIVVLGLIVGSVAAAPAFATAQFGPSPVEVSLNSAFDVYTHGPSSQSVGSISSSGGSATANLTPQPMVSVAASGKWAFHSSLQYYFTVTGAAGAIVPLIAYTTLGASRSANGYTTGESVDLRLRTKLV